MTRWIALFPASLALVLVGAFPLAAAERRAMIDGKVLSLATGSALRRIDLGTDQARLPQFSPDGGQLALVTEGNTSRSLAVFSLASGRIRQFALNPEGYPVGMRFAEKIVWAGSTRLAVSGSVNPSLVETVILDLIRGMVVERIYSDAHGITFSDDGMSFAYLDGMPHFAPQSSWRPTLKVNHRTIYRLTDRRLQFAGPARFIKGGQGIEVALASTNRAAARLTLTRDGAIWRSDISAVSGKVRGGHPSPRNDQLRDPYSTVWTDSR